VRNRAAGRKGRAYGWIAKDLGGNDGSLLEVLLSHLAGGSGKIQ